MSNDWLQHDEGDVTDEKAAAALRVEEKYATYLQAKAQQNYDVCPSCGYCPHCKRANWYSHCVPPQPYTITYTTNT